jgi:hypothetical protein
MQVGCSGQSQDYTMDMAWDGVCHGWLADRWPPKGLVKNINELGRLSKTEMMNLFQIGSRRTFCKVRAHAGAVIKPIDHSGT